MTGERGSAIRRLIEAIVRKRAEMAAQRARLKTLRDSLAGDGECEPDVEVIPVPTDDEDPGADR